MNKKPDSGVCGTIQGVIHKEGEVEINLFFYRKKVKFNYIDFILPEKTEQMKQKVKPSYTEVPPRKYKKAKRHNKPLEKLNFASAAMTLGSSMVEFLNKLNSVSSA